MNCCAVNFNDFTLDGGATNPNSLQPLKRKANTNLDANYEKRRAAILAKNDKKDRQKEQKAAFRANKKYQKSSSSTGKKRFAKVKRKR